MKYFIYIAVGLILAGSLMPNLNHAATASRLEIVLESPKASLEELQQAKDVLSKRLNAFGIHTFEISVEPEQRQLAISLEDGPKSEALLPLLLTVGKLDFCEVFTQLEALKFLQASKQWETWVHWLPQSPEGEGKGAIVGVIPSEEMPAFSRFIREPRAIEGLPANLHFAFGREPGEAGALELYALKYGEGMAPLLSGEAVDRSSASYDGHTGGPTIGITFNEEGRTRWAQVTRENMGRPIAVVIDGQVYLAPRVMAEVTGGKAQITGTFSYEEAQLLAALIQGGALPAPFQLKSVRE